MSTIVWGIVIFVVAFFGSRLLCVYVRKPLVEFCQARGMSASPWLTLLPVAYGGETLQDRLDFIAMEIDMGGAPPNMSYIESSTSTYDFWLGIACIVIPLLIVLIKTRKYFVPVLIIKIICIPLDIFYVIHLCIKQGRFAEGIPASKEEFRNGSQYRQSTKEGGYADGESTYTRRPVEEKYSDQYRASGEADSYHTVSSESEERYYSGDYVPFVSEGEVTEVRTYDSDELPMD